jgi:hypothetical protein
LFWKATSRNSAGLSESAHRHLIRDHLAAATGERRPDEAQRHRLQVLHGGRQMKLVACTSEAAQPHALESVVGLQVPEAQLDTLAQLQERLGAS